MDQKQPVSPSIPPRALCIRSNRDRHVVAHYWIDMCAALGIKLTPTVAFHPRANGAVERVNALVSQQLRILCAANADWPTMLPMAEFTII